MCAWGVSRSSCAELAEGILDARLEQPRPGFERVALGWGKRVKVLVGEWLTVSGRTRWARPPASAEEDEAYGADGLSRRVHLLGLAPVQLFEE